jgi:branched-subunit amino acid transport protein
MLWLAVCGLAGIVAGIFYVCQKNTTVTMIVSQL